MEKRWMLIGLVGIAVVSLTMNTVVASWKTSASPLFNYRMQQASNKMNFTPAVPCIFTYTAEKGCSLGYQTCEACFGKPLPNFTRSTCDIYEQTCDTCYDTCPGTCYNTCPNSCGTCGTCYSTCSTCSTCYPSPTCFGPTCMTMCLEC